MSDGTLKAKPCPNCEGENARSGHVEDWDGVCPDCGRKIRKGALSPMNEGTITMYPKRNEATDPLAQPQRNTGRGPGDPSKTIGKE
jgi:hypothetical protein